MQVGYDFGPDSLDTMEARFYWLVSGAAASALCLSALLRCNLRIYYQARCIITSPTPCHTSPALHESSQGSLKLTTDASSCFLEW